MLKNSLRPFYQLLMVLISDLTRLRTLFFVGVGNFLPDSFFFSHLRVYFLMLAGAHVKSPSTCIVRKNFFTENAGNIFLGSHVQINRNVIISGHGKTVLGDHVFLSYGVKIYTIAHQGMYHENDIVSDVTVGSNTVLYADTIVLPGVNVGSGVSVGAGSVIVKSVPDKQVWAGNPARFIKENSFWWSSRWGYFEH